MRANRRIYQSIIFNPSRNYFAPYEKRLERTNPIIRSKLMEPDLIYNKNDELFKKDEFIQQISL